MSWKNNTLRFVGSLTIALQIPILKHLLIPEICTEMNLHPDSFEFCCTIVVWKHLIYLSFSCFFFSHLNKVCNHPSFIIQGTSTYHPTIGKPENHRLKSAGNGRGYVIVPRRVSFQNLNLKDLKTSPYDFFRIHIFLSAKKHPQFHNIPIFPENKSPSTQQFFSDHCTPMHLGAL